jgi:DNA-damage-inducible protein J
MAKTIQVRVDEQLKADVEALFSELGLDVSTAVRMFFMAALREQGLPFEACLLNDETVQAMIDAREGRNLVGPFDTVEEMMASLEADDEYEIEVT